MQGCYPKQESAGRRGDLFAAGCRLGFSGSSWARLAGIDRLIEPGSVGGGGPNHRYCRPSADPVPFLRARFRFSGVFSSFAFPSWNAGATDAQAKRSIKASLRNILGASTLFSPARGAWPLELVGQSQQHNHMQPLRRRGGLETFDPRRDGVARAVSFPCRRVDEVFARFVIIGRGDLELHKLPACPDRLFGHACKECAGRPPPRRPENSQCYTQPIA